VQERYRQMHFFEVGRELIVFVDQVRQTENGFAGRWLHRLLHSYVRTLDQIEQEVVESARTGAHLTPPSDDGDLRDYLFATRRIVRATLTEIGEASTEWRISEVVCKVSPLKAAIWGQRAERFIRDADRAATTVTVGLDAWRLRAEAIVADRAARQVGRKPREEEIDAEFARLVKQDFTLGQEALLFLPDTDPEGEIMYKFIGIVRRDPEAPEQFDRLEQKIRQRIERITSGEETLGAR